MYLSGPDGPYTGPLPDPIPGAPIALCEEGAAFYDRLRRIEQARKELWGVTSPDLATWYAPVVEEPMSGYSGARSMVTGPAGDDDWLSKDDPKPQPKPEPKPEPK